VLTCAFCFGKTLIQRCDVAGYEHWTAAAAPPHPPLCFRPWHLIINPSVDPLHTMQNNIRVFVGGVLVFGGRPAQAEGDSGVYANAGSSIATLSAALQPALHVSNKGVSAAAAASAAAAVEQGAGEEISPAVDQLVELVADVLSREGEQACSI
jgi:hypothetical protein